MCCTFSTERRKCWALIVTVLSVIVCICSIIMVALSLNFYNKEDDIWSADMGERTDDAKNIKSMIFASLLVFSLVGIVVGAAGMTCGCGPCCKPQGTCYRLWPVLYGCILFFVWLIYMIVGGIVTGISTAAPENLQKFCDGKLEMSNDQANEQV